MAAVCREFVFLQTSLIVFFDSFFQGTEGLNVGGLKNINCIIALISRKFVQQLAI